ncbi:MAG: DUF4127 family protein [Blastocatellia bacterium]|nr:DUF4127 family protein [Blastocatellia bacterium]
MNYITFYCFSPQPRGRAFHAAFRTSCSALLLLSLLVIPSLAQRQRPKILQPQHHQYAGRLLLIPRDGRPISWKLPRMIARIADYEILYPPREMLGDATTAMDADRVIAWAKNQNLSQLNGVIVALDALTEKADAVKTSERLDLINWLRQRAPDLPIYGFAEQANDAISKLVFDDLWLEPNANQAAYLLVARLLNRIHQRPPKVMLTLSNAEDPAIIKTIVNQVATVGGQVIKNGRADLLLFVHTPETDPAKLAVFIETLAKTVAAGYYVSLADVSGNREPLIAALRERKQLDLLQAYAASRAPEQALSKVLAQGAVRLIAAKVLRPGLEVEQLRRAERAQIELMLVRYLEDWAYAGNIRPRVEQYLREQLKADPNQLGETTEAAEAYANAELKLIAEEIFRTQFRYNLHSVMLGNGMRADFQVELLQRFKARFPLQRTSELELDVSIHLPLLIGMSQFLRR